MMKLFYEYTEGLTIFAKKLHQRCSTGLYIGLRIYWNFQREAKLEQIIPIVTTQSVFLLMLIISVLIKKNSPKHHKYYEFCYYADYFSLGCMYNIIKQAKRYHETDFIILFTHPPVPRVSLNWHSENEIL